MDTWQVLELVKTAFVICWIIFIFKLVRQADRRED